MKNTLLKNSIETSLTYDELSMIGHALTRVNHVSGRNAIVQEELQSKIVNLLNKINTPTK